MLRTVLLTLALAAPTLITPAGAQIVEVPYLGNGEIARDAGPNARYLQHVLKLGAARYSVLFEPGYVDQQTALASVAPLCAKAGLQAQPVGTVSPPDVVVINGERDILQAFVVDCR